MSDAIDWPARKARARAYLKQRKLKLTPIPLEIGDKHQWYWRETTTYAHDAAATCALPEGR